MNPLSIEEQTSNSQEVVINWKPMEKGIYCLILIQQQCFLLKQQFAGWDDVKTDKAERGYT